MLSRKGTLSISLHSSRVFYWYCCFINRPRCTIKVSSSRAEVIASRCTQDYLRSENAVCWYASEVRCATRNRCKLTPHIFLCMWKPSEAFVSVRKWNCIGKATRYSITLMRPQTIPHRKLRFEGDDCTN